MTGFEMIPAAWIDEAVAAYNWRRDGRASELHALADIFGLASTTDHDMPLGRGSIRLARGQLVLTQRFVHDRWGWEKGRLRRWLARLEAQGRIRVERATLVATLVATLGRDRVPTLVSIVGYGTYGVSRPSHQPSLAPSSEPSRPPNPQIGIPQMGSPREEGATPLSAVAASEPAAPPASSRKRAPKAPKPDDPLLERYRRFRAWWMADYPRHHDGVEYLDWNAADNLAARYLLGAYPDGTRLVSLIRDAWASPDAYTASQSATVRGFRSIVQRVAAVGVAPSRNGRGRDSTASLLILSEETSEPKGT